MKTTLKLAATALALALAAPAFAQATPATPAGPATASKPGDREIVTRTVGADGKVIEKRMVIRGGDHGRMGGMGNMGWGFAKLSPEGRETMRAAMKVDRTPDRAAIEAARNRMLDVLAADRLDVAALRSAMAAERAAAETRGEAHQAAMLAAFQKLSAADRKAFATSMRDMHVKMEGRMKEIRERMKGMRGKMMRHGHGEMPMPPEPPMPPKSM